MPITDTSSCTELQAAYLTQTTKLAKLTAALGLPGDESTEILVAHARCLILTRARLLSAALAVRAAATPSIGQVFITPATFEQLSIAIDKAHAQKQPTV